MPKNNMTSLKIVDNNDVLDVDGYVGLASDFLKFHNSPPGQYDKFIGKRRKSFDFIDGTWPSGSNSRKVVWQDDNAATHKIDRSTNRIKVFANESEDEEDKQRTVISVPEEPIDNVNYLAKYVEIIWDQKDCTWDEDTPDDVIDEAKERAAKFLFGMLLITRCR